MSTLDEQFDAAVTASTTLPQQPDQTTMLKIYALFKQARRATSPASARASPTRWGGRSTTPVLSSRVCRPTTPNSSTSI